MSAWHPTATENALLDHVIKANGHERQVIKTVEEYAEAAAAIARFSNRYCHLDEVAAELADTQIMLAQLCKIHPELPEAISQQRAIKMATAAVRFNFSETKPE